MSLKSYRKEYPRPQFVREHWLNMNGEWDFRFDDGNIGEREQWFNSLEGNLKIQVPFAYETKASGIGEPEFHPYVWYQRQFSVPTEQQGKQVILNFQAVDYVALVWINGVFVVRHEGVYAAFSFDITPYILTDANQDNLIVV